MNASVLERFMQKVEITATCWLWSGARTTNGYGELKVDGRPRYAHRLSFEHHRGPIPIGLHLDHLCRVRHCVNPSHLDPVTSAENTRRGEPHQRKACPRGHLKSEHMRRDRGGRPYCLVCAREKSARRKAARAATR